MSLRSILKEFINHVESMEKRRLLGDNFYDREFQKLKELTDRLKNDPDYSCKAGQLEANRRKNRYKDILPYDRTRVILQEVSSDPNSDYINANYIKGSSGSMAYIAAQGPLPQTVTDFWRMVWQCEVQVVVMACNEREGGKTKCDYYWPAIGEKKVYYDIVIQTVKVKPICEDFLVRTWKLVRGNEQRTVCQFHYMTWPDHGIPSSVNPILHMIRMIRNCQATETIPVLVHCSAGCGRTGTFCAIDQVWGLLRTGKLHQIFSLYKMVAEMRYQRVAMVQTKEQYMLVHRAVATLFQQQLCIIDSHPYQNINRLGEPIGPIAVDHIYENVDPVQLDGKNEPFEVSVIKPLPHKPLRLDTPPSSETETDHSSEEFESYQAHYRQIVPNLSETKHKRSKTLLRKLPGNSESASLLSKQRSHTLVTLQEEAHIKKLLSDLNKASDNGQSTYKPRCNRTGSQDDINVTYSPERSFVYISDSDDSDSDIKYKCEVTRKPSIAKLRALFETSSYKLDIPSPPTAKREITRSHSQRVTRSNVSPFGGKLIPVMKSDSFNIFNRKDVHKPTLHPKGMGPQKRDSVPMDNNSNMLSLSNQRSNLSLIENQTPNEQIPNNQSPEKPQLPIKQSKILKPKPPEPSSRFCTDNEPGNSVIDSIDAHLKSRNRSNEFTSTGTRKPPVLPRKRFIGGRAPAANSSLDDKGTKSDNLSDVSTINTSVSNLNEVGRSSEIDSKIPEVCNNWSKLSIEHEAEKFHGSGGSIFYGSCGVDVSDAVNSNSDTSPKQEKFEETTNCRSHTEHAQSANDQPPQRPVVDPPTTKMVDLIITPPQLNESNTSSNSTGSNSQSVSFDVTLPPRKPNRGYEPIWFGPNQKSLATSVAADEKEQPILIRENNYGRIAPRCRSEDKLLDCTNQFTEVFTDPGYGRIVFKSSSEPPFSSTLVNADALGKDSTNQTSDSMNSSDSSSESSKVSASGTSSAPNLLIHSPLTSRKSCDTPSSNLNVTKLTSSAEPEFNSAVAEIRNLIDELIFDSSGKATLEQPKRERCHSLDMLCEDTNGQPDVRERRPSTDLLDQSRPCSDNRSKNLNKANDATVSSALLTKQTIHNIPPIPALQITSAQSNSVSNSSDMVRFCSSSSSLPSTESNPDCKSVYYSTEESLRKPNGSDFQSKKPMESTWTASNWSDRIIEPSLDTDYKALSSTVLRTNPVTPRIYENPADLSPPELPPHNPISKKSRTNITRSVSARETKRPHVVKRDTESSSPQNHNFVSSATMRPLHVSSHSAKPHHRVLIESSAKIGNDDGYVTLAETTNANYNHSKSSDPKLRISNECGGYNREIPPKSPVQQNDSHLYASIHNYPDSSENNRSEFSHQYRTLPQPPPPKHPPPPMKVLPSEHIYSLPALPKYRPPPPPPQQRNPDLPTPPPSSEETSSSSSQSDTRPEPLYSQIQKQKKEPSPFTLSENLISAGYGQILSKTSQFSHDDLDVQNRPVAPPRKGKKLHKYARHSLLDLESQKMTWSEDNFQAEKSSPQWYIHQKVIQSDQNSEPEESAPNIPQKTPAAFQVPDDPETDGASDVGHEAGPISDV